MKNKNSVITWDESYSVGVEVFDEHHKKLIGIINELDGIIRKRETDKNFDEVLGKLSDYAIFHFTEEEEKMKEYMYPEFLKHKAEHEFFKRKLLEFKKSDVLNIGVALDAIKFLFDWLLNHIMIEDKKYEKYFVKIE